MQPLRCELGEFGIGSTNTPLNDIFLYSYHFSACYWVDIVGRYSVMVTRKNLKLMRGI